MSIPVSRREFMQRAVAGLALVSGVSAAPIPFSVGEVDAFQPRLLPSVDELWKPLEWMANLGPKYTGNEAHRTFVEYLAKNLESLGLEFSRDPYKFTRWDARRWGLKVSPTGGSAPAIDVPVTSYYPYSGQTGSDGVAGELVHLKGAAPQNANGFGGNYQASGDLTGKVVFVEVSGIAPPYSEWYKPWGFYTEEAKFPDQISGLWGILTPGLGELKKAGAVGVVLGWTNISDEQAMHQYTPFSRPLQDIPGVWVGRESTAKLRELAATGAKATVILEAQTFPDTTTDTLIAVLPGASSESVLIVNSHSDGTNATEENGGLGILALAKYFSKIPKSSRKRDIVFVVTTGHFQLAQLPSIQGFIQKHPELVKKAVGSVTIEHLGCREWLDNASGQYAPTGKDEMTFAITDFEGTAGVMLESVKGTGDRRVAVVKGRYFGEGGSLSRAGVPNIGYIPMPSYLVADPSNGCIEKLSKELFHSQIEVFAKVIHKMDGMTASELKGSSG